MNHLIGNKNGRLTGYKMIRPSFFSSIFGKKCLESLTPLITFTSNNLNQSSSGISLKGIGSKIPAFVNQMSRSGIAWIR